MTKETVQIVVMILLYYSVPVYFDQEPGTCSTYSCNEESFCMAYFQLTCAQFILYM